MMICGNSLTNDAQMYSISKFHGSCTRRRMPRKLLLKLVLREGRLMVCGLRTDRCIDNLCHGAVAEFAGEPFNGEDDDNNPSQSFGFRGIVSGNHVFRHPQMKLGQTGPNHLFRPCCIVCINISLSCQSNKPPQDSSRLYWFSKEFLTAILIRKFLYL